MNEQRSDDRNCCYFHPKVLVVGICALCLNERLLVLASKQAHLHQSYRVLTASLRKSPIALPKISALTSLLGRLDVKSRNTVDHDEYPPHSSSSSPEDSFISIKFEDNGVASWDKGLKKPHGVQCDASTSDSWDGTMKGKSVVEHAKPVVPVRWRRRVGAHLFQLIRWKRSGKGNVCHVGTKLEATKDKYGSVRTLTKRRTKDYKGLD